MGLAEGRLGVGGLATSRYISLHLATSRYISLTSLKGVLVLAPYTEEEEAYTSFTCTGR